MTISCPVTTQGPVVLPFCTPECTRWTGANGGQPIRLFHDISGWGTANFEYRTGVGLQTAFYDAPDPIVYMQPALDLWQQACPCITLWQYVNTEAEADVRIRYETHDDNAGDATCSCDVEGDVCVRQVDHSNQYGPGNPATLRIHHKAGEVSRKASYNVLINLYMHEFGHILGMGHVRTLNPPRPSIMGTPENINANLVLYDFDQEQMSLRYPCDCTLTANKRAFIADTPAAHSTADHCPICAGVY